MEDEDALRELDRQILMRYGYRVLHARTGPEALALVESHPGHIHLLLTDVVMPTMSGRELADRLQARFPALKVRHVGVYERCHRPTRGVGGGCGVHSEADGAARARPQGARRAGWCPLTIVNVNPAIHWRIDDCAPAALGLTQWAAGSLAQSGWRHELIPMPQCLNAPMRRIPTAAGTIDSAPVNRPIDN
ncbi:MAG: response regulator [Vicinamibacterales bacterium]